MNSMTIEGEHLSLISNLFKRGDQIRPQLTDSDLNMLHASIGIVTEAGELLEAISEAPVAEPAEERGWWDSHMNIENVREELGDHLFYDGALRMSAGMVTLPQGMVVTRATSRALGRSVDAMGDELIATAYRTLAVRHAEIAADIMDIVKRKAIYRKGWLDSAPGKPSLEDRMKQALHDDYQVVTAIARLCNLPVDQIRQANIEKLSTGPNARYASGTYSDAAALARADKDGKEEAQ